MTIDEVLRGIEYIYTNNKDTDPRAATAALTLAGKYHALFTDKTELSGRIEMPSIIIGK